MGLTKINVHNAESARELADVITAAKKLEQEQDLKIKLQKQQIMNAIEDKAAQGIYNLDLNTLGFTPQEQKKYVVWLEELGFFVTINSKLEYDNLSSPRGFIVTW